MLTQSIKVFLNESASKMGKSTVATTFIQQIVTGMPILVERDVSLGPETPIELMIRRILEEKLKGEQ